MVALEMNWGKQIAQKKLIYVDGKEKYGLLFAASRLCLRSRKTKKTRTRGLRLVFGSGLMRAWGECIK